ncbi:hypothetical protein [Kineococcus sp. G2]|uniref:hypothetical protein n=1 Tax=Kineococcus sp. G2 TaxID=3127484 RepID=UPI00301CDBE7
MSTPLVRPGAEADDPTAQALAHLREQALATIELLEQVVARADLVAQHRAAGAPYARILAGKQRPLIVELLSSAARTLSDAGGRYRREQAQALADEGLHVEEIAHLFGVTRQRVSALLKSRTPPATGARRRVTPLAVEPRPSR